MNLIRLHHINLIMYHKSDIKKQIGRLMMNLLFCFSNSGKLTSVGAKQLKCLGKRLRTRYTPEVSQVLLSASDDQRPEHSDSCGLLTFSSRTERTIESLRSLLVGLFEKEIREGVDPLVEVMVFASAETNWLLMPFKQ